MTESRFSFDKFHSYMIVHELLHVHFEIAAMVYALSFSVFSIHDIMNVKVELRFA